MASLPPFNNPFRHFYGGRSIAKRRISSKPGSMDGQENGPAGAHKGKDEREDHRCGESELDGDGVIVHHTTVNDCDIVKHLTESCRNVDEQYSGFGERRVTSSASTRPESDYTNTKVLFTQIEQDIDILKAEVLQMRNDAFGGAPPQTDDGTRIEQYLSTRNRDLYSSSKPSPAEQLRQVHDMAARTDCPANRRDSIVPAAPASHDFPALSPALTETPNAQMGSTHSTRTTSYATAVAARSSQLVSDHEKTIPTPERSLPERACASPMSALTAESIGSFQNVSSSPLMQNMIDMVTPLSRHSSKDGSPSTPTSQHGEETLNSAGKRPYRSTTKAALSFSDSPSGREYDESSESPKSVQGSSHFAHPAAAFERRKTIGDLSKASDSCSTPSISPKKTVKASVPSLATERRAMARHHKRQSLPGEWLHASPAQAENARLVSPKASPKTTPSKTRTLYRGKISAEVTETLEDQGWQVVNVDSIHNTASSDMPRSHLVEQLPSLRKKASTLLSPTESSKQRTVATLGKDNTKQTVLRTKGDTLRINIKMATATVKDTLSTTSSSETFNSTSPNAETSAGSSPYNVQSGSSGLFGFDGASDKRENRSSRKVTSHLKKTKATLKRTDSVLHSPARVPKSEGWQLCSPSTKPDGSKSHVDLTKFQSFGRATAASTNRAVEATDIERAAILEPIKRRLSNAGLLKGQQPPEGRSGAKVVQEKILSKMQKTDNLGHTRVTRQVPQEFCKETWTEPAATGDQIATDASDQKSFTFIETFRKTVTGDKLGKRKLVETVISDEQYLMSNFSDSPSTKLMKAVKNSVAQEGGEAAWYQEPRKEPVVAAGVVKIAREASAQHKAPHDRSKTQFPLDPSIVYKGRKPSGCSPLQQDRAVLACGPIRDPKRDQSVASSTHSGPYTSLRAEAPDFEPLWKPKTPARERAGTSWADDLDCGSDLDWMALPPHIHACIEQVRMFKKSYLNSRAGTCPPGSPPKNGSSTRQQQPLSGPLRSLTNGQSPIVEAQSPIVEAQGSSTVMQTPILPAASPEFITQATTQPIGISQSKAAMPTNFGRAPAPLSITSISSGSTPTISPTSTNSISPAKSDSSTRGWSINSANPGWLYGWHGGDGREIKFVGHGPDAERDPKLAVNYRNFQHDPSSGCGFTPVDGQGVFAGGEKKNTFSPPTAPRKMRQWAERMGYPKIPCGNMEIVDAVECIGGMADLTGYCHGCAPTIYAPLSPPR